MKHLYKLILGLLIAVAAPVDGFAQSVVLHDTIVCESYQWFDTTLTTTGSYGHIHNVGDSIVVDSLDLTVYYGTYRAFPKDTCDVFVWHGVSYGASGVYTYPYSNEHNCPSVDTLHLTINHTTYGDTTATVCGSFSWHGYSNLTESGEYTDTLENAVGCDSIVTLHLTVNPIAHTPIYATICQGEVFPFFNRIVDTSGVYTDTLYSSCGCDSVVTLHLTVNHTTYGDTTATACSSFSWHEYDNLTESGNYTDTMENAAGCDSIVTLHLTINTPIHESITRSECESFVWHDSIYTQSGNHFYVHPDANGCTQVDTLHLTIYHPAHKDTVVTACESFTWHGAAYTTSGIYTFAHQDEHYCWQVDTLHLTILSAFNTSIEETICQNELPFHYINGQIDTTFELGTPSRQTVLFVLTSSIGIDSVIALTLIVNPTPTPIIMGETTICEGESSTLTAIGGAEYSWNDNTTSYRLTVSESGTYTVTATSTENCSATASVTVTVNPLPTVVISGENSFCAGESTTLTASGSSTYIWNTTETTAELEVNRAGTYIVTGTDINGCSKSASQEIVMNVLPTIVISGENSFCAGESEDLTASGASTYIWNTTEGTPSITVNAAGTYSVTGTDVNH